MGPMLLSVLIRWKGLRRNIGRKQFGCTNWPEADGFCNECRKNRPAAKIDMAKTEPDFKVAHYPTTVGLAIVEPGARL